MKIARPTPDIGEIRSQLPYTTRNVSRKRRPAVAPALIFQRTIVATSLRKGILVRVLATVASVAGLLLTIGAFPFYAANALPYQNATPELLMFQKERAIQLGLVMLLGLAITIASSFYFWRSWRRGES